MNQDTPTDRTNNSSQIDRIKHIVALGGGAGPGLVAKALVDRLFDLTAVVSTTDTGGSSGICRRAFGIPAPGDLRATLSAFASLAGHEDRAELWETRLKCPDFEAFHGMTLGNLLICGLVQRTGDFAEAIEKAGELLGIQGRVLPVTAQSAHLEAELEGGAIVREELEVRRPGKPSIRRLRWAGPRPRPSPEVLEALGLAGFILMGPGCLYTSLLPCLMVEGISEAICASEGLRVYICNTTTTPGQTDDFTVARHVEVIWEALRRRGLDAVIINVAEPAQEARAAYEALGVSLLLPTSEDLRLLESMGIRILAMPLLEEAASLPRTLHKVDTFRHDPKKLRMALEHLLS